MIPSPQSSSAQWKRRFPRGRGGMCWRSWCSRWWPFSSSRIAAMFVTHALPQYRNATFTDLATNAAVVIGAQTAAYPVVLLFIFLMVRTRSHQDFGRAIQWNWPGMLAPAFLVGGVILALAVEGLARFLPIPKSLPIDAYFHDATSAYMMAAFGITLAPLLEELFFRGTVVSVAATRIWADCGRAADRGSIRCNPWCSAWLSLGAGVEHLHRRAWPSPWSACAPTPWPRPSSCTADTTSRCSQRYGWPAIIIAIWRR